MSSYWGRTWRYFLGSFILLTAATLVSNFHSASDIAFVIPTIIGILVFSLVASVISAAFVKTESWWAILIPQFLTSLLMWFAFAVAF
jgi:hypothetical protein